MDSFRTHYIAKHNFLPIFSGLITSQNSSSFRFEVIFQTRYTKGKTASESNLNGLPQNTRYFSHPANGWKHAGCLAGCIISEIAQVGTDSLLNPNIAPLV